MDYGLQYRGRLELLRRAYERSDVCETEDFQGFVREQEEWLKDYALFMALKDAHGGSAWNDWEPELALREPAALQQAERELADSIRY